jgi:hypothetical protein
MLNFNLYCPTNVPKIIRIQIIKSGFTRLNITKNPDFIIIMYHLELTPNSYEMKNSNVLNFFELALGEKC